MTRHFHTALILGLVALTIAVSYVGLQGYRDVTGLIALSEEVDESRVVLHGLREMIGSLRDAETSQRGFLLTGRPEYLDRYSSAREDVLDRIGRAATRSWGLEFDPASLGRLRSLTETKFTEMGRTIELARAGETEAAVAIVRTGEGERLKLEILALTDRLQRLEASQLEDRRVLARGYAGSSLRWLVAMLCGVLLVVTGLYALIAREIRGRRLTEAVLRESKRRLEGGFEEATIGMALIAPEGRLLKVNRALCECLGYSEAELLRLDYQTLTHPDDREADAVLAPRFLSGEISTARIEKRYLHKDGHAIPIVLGCAMVRDEAGRPLYWAMQIEDVTARVAAEALALEERRFIESIADAVPSLMYIFDLTERRNVWINARTVEIFGRTPQEMAALGDSILGDVIHPDDLPRLIAHYDRLGLARDGEVCEVEWRGRHVDGSWRWIRSREMAFVRDEAGRVTRLIGSGEDVTHRHLADLALREETVLRKAIVDGAGYAIISSDVRGTIRSFNAAAERMLGYDAGELIGWSSPLLFHDPDEVARRADELTIELGRPIEPGLEVFVASVREGGIDERDWTYVRKDGGRLPVRLAISALRDASGRPSGYLGIAGDLTERNRTLSELARARAQLSDAIDSLDSGLIMFDQDERMVLCNRRYNEMYPAKAGLTVPGVRFEDMIRGSYKILPPDEAEASVEEQVRKRATIHRTYRGVHEQEIRGRWLRIGDFPTAEGGVVSLHTDITEQKRIEADLRSARDAAESAARAKAEFLANMSHEIRTPMNGVLGMAELALGTPLTSRQREYVAAIKSSAESLLTVINDILDFSKVEAGKLQLDRVAFGLRALLDDTLRPFAPDAAEKGLELCVRIGAGAPDVLLGDPHRLRQVLVNLVGNALKFTRRGEVVVSVEPSEGFGPDSKGVLIEFSVSDTGIGVPEDRRAAIFNAFEQADGSTTRKFGGTGLGLAISARLVALMGGSIRVDGRPGGGSDFRFTARFDRPTEEEGRPFELPVAHPGLIGLPVLVVVDHATSRSILGDLLSAWRMEPVAVADLPAGLAAIRGAEELGRPFAAALVEGEDVARSIVERAEVPLILIGSADLDTDTDATPRPPDPSVVARLNKPIRQSELFNALVALIARGTVADGGEVPGQGAEELAPTLRSLSILLAEDNPTNQIVATHLLDRLGHRTVVAGDGRAAIASLDSGLFDLVLMDLQMPEMDGFQALAAIRGREERSASPRRMPVVALTAHAMTGDRERCLAAGFDAYLPKPIRIAELSKTLAEFAGTAHVHVLAQAPQVDPIPPTGPGPVSFNPETLAESCGGVAEIIAEVLNSFLSEAPADLDRLAVAFDSGDPRALRRAAHGLKGACLTVGAEALADACLRLEHLPADVPPTLADSEPLSHLWDDLRTAIVAHRDSLDLTGTGF